MPHLLNTSLTLDAGYYLDAGAVTRATTPIPYIRVAWRPGQFNRIQNPDFETNTTFWDVGAGINAAATSITRITTDSHDGSACGRLICTSTFGSGMNYDFGTGRFYQEATYGSMYKALVWLKRSSGSRRARLILGSEGTADDRATLNITDLTDQWQPYTVNWVPSGNRTDVQLAITNGSAAALTVLVDEVSVYQIDAFSQVENGTFEDTTLGWSVAAGSFAAAATSLTRTTGGFGGTYCGRLVTTAAASSGATWDLLGRKWTSGRTYRARVAVKAVSGATGFTLEFGSPTASDSATVDFSGSDEWTWVTVDWTPAADRRNAELAVYSAGTSIRTLDIDEVEAYEAYDDVSLDVGGMLRWDRSIDGIGSITARVLSDDGLYDPRYASSPLYGVVSPGKRIWARASYDDALHPMFFGTIRTIEQPELGGLYVDLVADDAFGDMARATVSHDMDQNDTWTYARKYSLAQMLMRERDPLHAGGIARRNLTTLGIEGSTFYNGTDGDVPLLDYLGDLNEATGTVHWCDPSVHANIGYRYTTVDRATLTDDSSDFTVNEDFEDLDGLRVTDEALENRQDVPWQAYAMLPPPINSAGFGLVAVARDVSVYSTTVDADDPYLHYTDDDFGTDDDHPEVRWRHRSPKWIKKRLARGLKVKRRRKVFLDPFVPFTMAAGEVRRIVLDFAIPMSGLQVLLSDTSDTYIWYDADTGTHTIRVDYVEVRPQRLTVDLVCISDDTVALFEVWATPWQPLDEVVETRHDYESQALIGTHQGPVVGTSYIPSAGAAQGIGDFRNWRYGRAIMRPTLVDHMEFPRTLTIDLTDHLTVTATRWRISALLFMVVGRRWEVTQGGLVWRSWSELEEVRTHSDWFILDTSELSGLQVLAY